MSADAGREPFREEYLTVIATRWIEAMAPHLDGLIRLSTPAPDRQLQTHPTENAHAIAAFSMLAFALESLSERLTALPIARDPSQPASEAHRTPVDVLKALGAPELADQVEELLVVRNTLVHNHIYGVSAERDDAMEVVAGSVEIRPLTGYRSTPRYLRAAGEGRGTRTAILGLHLVPDQVRRHDVAVAVGVAIAAMDAMTEGDIPNMSSLADWRIRVGDWSGCLRALAPRLAVASD